mmetsp:Transcript_63854/g.113921  ORF Transcript_63854/g.113921 Transcript_63854/m.113921 type:complete len:420 (-) Transcript_63854:97-1356(-)
MLQACCLVLCFILVQASLGTAEQCGADNQCEDANQWLQHRVMTEEQDDRENMETEETEDQYLSHFEDTEEEIVSEQEHKAETGIFLRTKGSVDRVSNSDNVTFQEYIEGANDFMEKMLSGAISKTSMEVVLARYDEDISWSDPYKDVRTVYCKDRGHFIDACDDVLDNVGREAHTYLHHIVHNYDKLADWTVFTQAEMPSIGYRGHKHGRGQGGHLMPGTTFDSYVLPASSGGIPEVEGAVFVMTASVSMDNLNHSLRLSFRGGARKPAIHFAGACPQTALGDGWQQWWQLGKFQKFIAGRCGVPEDKLPQHFQHYWDTYIQAPWPKDHVVFFTQGARFAASRERIQQRPRSYYEDLLALLSTVEDSCWGYFNEWSWFYIIGSPEEGPCDRDLLLQQANMKRKSHGSKTQKANGSHYSM